MKKNTNKTKESNENTMSTLNKTNNNKAQKRLISYYLEDTNIYHGFAEIKNK